jgi:hypothetical protein
MSWPARLCLHTHFALQADYMTAVEDMHKHWKRLIKWPAFSSILLRLEVSLAAEQGTAFEMRLAVSARGTPFCHFPSRTGKYQHHAHIPTYLL